MGVDVHQPWRNVSPADVNPLDLVPQGVGIAHADDLVPLADESLPHQDLARQDQAAVGERPAAARLADSRQDFHPNFSHRKS